MFRLTQSAGDLSEPLRLFEIVATSPGNEDLLATLKHQADQVIPLLDEGRGDDVLAQHAEKLDICWLQRVYEALLDAGTAQRVGCDVTSARDVGDRWTSFDAAYESRVGQAFANSLLASLPAALRDFGTFFAGVPTVDEAIHARLLSLPEVHDGGPEAAELARFAIAPTTIANAALALSTLALRETRAAKEPIVLVFLALSYEVQAHDVNPTGQRAGFLGRGAIVHRLVMTTELGDRVCERLLDWIALVIVHRPMLIKRFCAHRQPHSLLLERHRLNLDLFDQWGMTAEGAAAAMRRAPQAGQT